MGEYDGYAERVQALCESARAYVRHGLLEFGRRFPGATVRDWRDAGAVLLRQAAEAYGDMAVAAACDEYDRVAQAQGVDCQGAARDVGDLPQEAYDRPAAYLADKVAHGDVPGFVKAMAAKASDYVSQSANRAVVRNASRDRRRGMRYARVPTGRETCGFCLMLASRGFVYHGARAAGLFDRYHDNCDCRVVPGRAGSSVPGYDPDWYREVYDDCRAACGSADPDDICREIERRDRGWAWFREAPEAEYAKPRDALEPHERAGVDALASHGFAVATIPEDGSARSNLDLRMGGRLWEMKDVSGESSISNQIKRARQKWWKAGLESKPRFVFTTERLPDGVTFDGICDGVERRLRPGEEALVLSPTGGPGPHEARRLKK